MKNVSLLIGLFAIFLCKPAFAQTFDKFKTPDESNKVITYWMWMNGNITKEGITKDLEAMKAAGINGTLMFSCGFYQPGPVKFMSQEWWDDIAHAMKESERLHMTMGFYNSDGWSMSGGPWISPETSMKELTWADTTLQGGGIIHLKLAQPESKLMYADIAVLAFPAVINDKPLAIKKMLPYMVSDIAAATDGNPKTITHFLKAPNGKTPNILFDFGQQISCRRVVFDKVASEPFLDADALLEYSNDGKIFTNIAYHAPLNLKAEAMISQVTLTFPEVKARYIRLSVPFTSSSKYTPVNMGQTSVNIGEIAFYQSPRVNLWEPKSGESKRIRHERMPTFMKELNTPTGEDLPNAYCLNAKNVINVTKMVNANGVLNWDAPKGNWVIQRIGYTSTGRKVGPATKEGSGLECNKMDAKAVETHFNNYMAKIIDLSVKTVGHPISSMQMESWEAGIQNWTAGFEDEFKKRNGYDITPYLPILAGGYVVNSYDTSNRFLWDFRRTCAQLIAENYWGTMHRMGNANGVTVSGEGSGMQHYLYDPLMYQKYTDIPMGELWPNETRVRPDVKGASSAAHIFGRDLSGGESFTNGSDTLWSFTPSHLKQIGDEALTSGSNYFVLHTYVHQPYDQAPGFTLTRFGTHLQRLNPWFTRSQGWLTYLQRCQYMLRQGKSIQDLAYFTGEGIPGYLGMPEELHPKLPKGFDYDGVNYEVIRQMSVKNGRLYLPSGANYQALVFQDISVMTPGLIKELKRLVIAGATIISKKPAASPSLTDNNDADNTVKKIAQELWGNIDGKTIKQNKYGKGYVFDGMPVNDIMKTLNAIPDFVYKANIPLAQINYIHRRTRDADIYFLANYKKEAIQATCKFRISNKIPEMWDAEKGIGRLLKYRKVNSQQIEVSLNFTQQQSMFVVFKDAPTPGLTINARMVVLKSYPLNGAWNLHFRSMTADTFKTVFRSLTDWSKNQDSRIRFFSGSATYAQDVQLNDFTGRQVQLNLGNVNNGIARVIVNRKEVARLWIAPYNVDITPYVKKGYNHVEIDVTNTAVNALIGDERYPLDLSYNKGHVMDKFPAWIGHPEQRKSQRKTFVTFRYLTKDSPLAASGLIGPVSINVLTAAK